MLTGTEGGVRRDSSLQRKRYAKRSRRRRQCRRFQVLQLGLCGRITESNITHKMEQTTWAGKQFMQVLECRGKDFHIYIEGNKELYSESRVLTITLWRSSVEWY